MSKKDPVGKNPFAHMGGNNSDCNHDGGGQFVHDFRYSYVRIESKCILLA